MKSSHNRKEFARLKPPLEPDPSDDPTEDAPGMNPESDSDDMTGLA